MIRDLPEEREEWNPEQKLKFRNVKLAVLLFATGAVIAAAGIGMSRGREGNNTVLKSETAVQDQKPDDAEKIPGERSETEQTEEIADKSVEEEIQQETKQEVINDPVVPE